MQNLSMYCISMKSGHLNVIKDFNYIPVGLGSENFSNEWKQDKSGNNIAHKNKYYGEYTFHYWLWKNHIKKELNEGWIGFCQYRKFWTSVKNFKKPNSIKELNSLILKEIPQKYENYDVILGEEMATNKLRMMKFLKKGFSQILQNPSTLFNKNKRTIKFHFDMWHGSKYLNEAIKLLDIDNRNDFKDFVNLKTSFNPHNMLICKSKKILIDYYDVVFPWLERCENLFGFKDLSGYGQIRIYGFLAERFMSYWFQKNTKHTTLPVVFYDISNETG